MTNKGKRYGLEDQMHASFMILIINAAGMWDISTMDAERTLYYMEAKELIKFLRDHYSEVNYIEANKPNISDQG